MRESVRDDEVFLKKNSRRFQEILRLDKVDSDNANVFTRTTSTRKVERTIDESIEISGGPLLCFPVPLLRS